MFKRILLALCCVFNFTVLNNLSAHNARLNPDIMPTEVPVNLLENIRFKEFLDAFTKLSESFAQVSFNEQRKLSTEFFLSKGAVYVPVKHIENTEVPGQNGSKIPLRIYRPSDSKILPVLIFFHRGGWIFGSIEEADPVCRKLANHLECVVISVEYRLAPENPFPIPVEDCYTATQWISENADHFGGNSKNLIVCGESSGGNLAAAVALMARDKNGPLLSAQLLIYPAISAIINDADYDSCVDRYFLTKETMKFFWGTYLQSPENYKNVYASPGQAGDLSNLPPTLLITAEYDPLSSEGLEYAKKLSQAGVKVVTKCFPEVIHGFIDLPIYEENQKVAWIKEIAIQLKQIRMLE